MQNRIVLLLGGNLGDREMILKLCVKSLTESVGDIVAVSGLYISEPWGFNCEVPDFWNCVLILDSALNPFEVLKQTQQIEKELGRTHKGGYEYRSRIIDIDLLFFNDDIIREKDLEVPHHGIPHRRFVLEPLNELLTDFRHPVLHKRIDELLNECTDHSNVYCEKMLTDEL
jgi:2-amino-4-hydroxy-6-hydroxymethyldihydropteridine diphosphokinase